jgi:phage shock protein B
MFIGGGAFVLGVIFLTVIAPIWIVFHYITKWRAVRRLSAGDEKALGELWQAAQRLEARIATLERILDSEAPGWRMRAGA